MAASAKQMSSCLLAVCRVIESWSSVKDYGEIGQEYVAPRPSLLLTASPASALLIFLFLCVPYGDSVQRLEKR